MNARERLPEPSVALILVVGLMLIAPYRRAVLGN
jgi:hypothetical protein